VDDDVMKDEEGRPEAIPVAVLAAMKDRMHARRFSSVGDPGYLHETLGDGDSALSIVDDGPETCMIGRPVGRTPDGSVYVLVARIPVYGYEQLRDGEIEVADIYVGAGDISLCAVYESDGMVGNIALVRHYSRADAIPLAYRPPNPFLEFSDEEYPDDDDEPSGPRLLHGAFIRATDGARRLLKRGPTTPGPTI
jgi:hypothetical protein